jgi:hypothetical protein
MEKLACFTVQFDGDDNPPKHIWADAFRPAYDGDWVEFLDHDSKVVSTVRTIHILAIDRNCRPPLAEGNGYPDFTAGDEAPSQQAHVLQPVPSVAPVPAGPIEAGLLRQSGVPQPRTQPAAQGEQQAAAAAGR